MNNPAHRNALSSLIDLIKNVEGTDEKQDKESYYAFKKIHHMFTNLHSVSKPVKKYFEGVAIPDGSNHSKEAFDLAILSSHQTAFKNWEIGGNVEAKRTRTGLLNEARKYFEESLQSPSAVSKFFAEPYI